MVKKTKAAWTVSAEDKIPSADELNAPPSEADAKPLDELLKMRPERPVTPAPAAAAPAAPAAPAKPPTPPTPLSEKEIADALEQAAKALVASSLEAEKSRAAIAKLSMMGSNTDKDRSVVSRAERLIVQIERVKGSLDMLAKEVGEYKAEMSKPAGSSWL